jgi:hypothetical protein
MSTAPLVSQLLLILSGFLMVRVPGLFIAWALANVVLFFAVLIYWTHHIRDDESLNRNEQRLWWAVIWLGGAAGLAVYIYFRVWLDEPLGVKLPGPHRSLEQELETDRFDT